MITLRPKHREARKLLALAHCTLGEIGKAANILEEWLEEEPENPIARHMLAACTGRGVPKRASNDFIEATFDSFASSFESKLERLSYRAPALIAAMLQDSGVEQSRCLDVLDAGCGTGLCGPIIAPFARRLLGVDLSQGMLAHAKEKNVYDGLTKSELTEYLRDHGESFDLIVSADTLVYFGDLTGVIAALSGALRPNGLAVFSSSRRSQEARAPTTVCNRTAVTVTRRRMSSGCSRFRACGRISFEPSCARRQARQCPGWSFVRRNLLKPYLCWANAESVQTSGPSHCTI